MIYITHILLIMAAIWDIKKMEVPLTISVMLYLVHTCELLSSNYWKIDFIGMILCFSIFAFAMIWSIIPLLACVLQAAGNMTCGL